MVGLRGGVPHRPWLALAVQAPPVLETAFLAASTAPSLAGLDACQLYVMIENVEAKTVIDAVDELEKVTNSLLNRARTLRSQRLQLKQNLTGKDQELTRLEGWQARQKEREKEVLWRLEKVVKALDRMGVEA